MDQIKKILAPGNIRSWRKKVARSNGTVAVVAGSFDIFQPGNLQAIRTAAKQASHVCIVVDADTNQQNRGWAWNSAEVRMELVSHLRDATVVLQLAANQAQAGFQDLRPYRLVDCMSRPAETTLYQIARTMAESVMALSPILGCFTPDISARILRDATPVPIDPGICAPLPGPADLDRLQQNRTGRVLVTVNGCFDILHLGHLRMLAEARQKGDELIVLINDDASVRAYKNPTRPVFPVHFRITALQALTSVSLAYPFSGDNPLDLIAKIKPDIHVKGGTYEENRVRRERELLASWGGRLEFCPLVEGYSTTAMIKRTGG